MTFGPNHGLDHGHPMKQTRICFCTCETAVGSPSRVALL